ncbi:MAG: efflux RND transporter permease subunit [Candidatus Krumholzibacteria bacterium]|nr:efflux RND transporter permease subunit [Candidatus Krumholzibacteria bacterium]
MTRFFVRHPVTTWMIFTMFVVLGIYSLPKLQIEAMPEVDLPELRVFTRWNGASPKAIQRSITIPVEEAARNVHGVEEIESRSNPGWSQVTVKFRREIDIDFARMVLNEQLGSVRRNLPLGAGQPEITVSIPEEFRTEDFFTFSLESGLDTNELRELTERWVVPQLLALEGVADANIMGGADPLIKIVLDRRKLELYRIGAGEVYTSLDRLDDFIGAGVVFERGMEKLVALREPVDIRKLENAVVARRGGQTFTLKMLGEVRLDHEDPTWFPRANGKNIVLVSVDKRSGANTVTVSRTLRKALPGIQEGLPFEVTYYIDEDQGQELEDKLRELVYRSFIILGILFMLLVITLRQVKLTAVVTASILFAIVISLSLFYFLDISVNFITISGLTVCFGLILDNSILVLDSVHRRLNALEKAEKAGLSRKTKFRVAVETIVGGTKEVLFPILATTLTTMVAFASFIFLSGRLALYYVPLAISVVTAMLASLFVAFCWVPMVLDRWWARPLVRHSSDGPNEVDDPEELTAFVEDLPDLHAPLPLFEKMFYLKQKIAWVMIPICGVLFWWGWHVYDTKVNKGGFWQFPSREELLCYVEMPSGTDVELTSETLYGFEKLLLPIPEGARMTARAWGNQAFLNVEFEDELLKTTIPLNYRALLIEKADKTGGASVFIRGFSDRPYFKGAFGGSNLNSLVKITGYNSKKLSEIAERAKARASKSRRVRDVRIVTGGQWDRHRQQEMVITIRRDRLAAHALTVQDLVSQVQRLLGVDFPWTMLIEGEQERLQLSYDDSDDISYTDIADKVIRNQDGEQVRLGDLIDIEKREMSRSITRTDQRYTAYVNWEYVGTDQMRTRYIKDIITGVEDDLPYGYTVEESTREFLTEEEEEELNQALWLALVFIFMVMAALFESVTLPLLVLMSVPMALVGVFVIFWLTNSTFDSSAKIGLILMFGIVVNNAILLITRFRMEAELILKVKQGGEPAERAALFKGLRRQLGGGELFDLPKTERASLLRRAVARGTRIRLRSILLTSGTTVAGLAPLLVHLNETEDKDIWENLALASIGGLVASTILLILVMPPLYYYCVRTGWTFRSFFLWLKRKLKRSPKTTPTETPQEA